MSERRDIDAQESPPPNATRSGKLIALVIILAILPLVLLFPSAFLSLKWIVPALVPALAQCPTYCPPSTDGERLEWLLILGPSMLTTVALVGAKEEASPLGSPSKQVAR